ncbi:MAG: AMP-binding protein, partial [candidate division NC10 bacterium]|nr:AMP-binding protein [candidate division NC10 bacterium]
MTIRDILEKRAGDSRPFLFFGDSVYSFRDFTRHVTRTAHGLLACGVQPGSGVALMLPNSPLWLILYCALQTIGAYAVPIHTFLRGNLLARILAHSDARFLVLDAEFREAWEEIRDRVPQIAHLLLAGASPDDGIHDRLSWT